jgi:hypothetical protein
MGVNEREEIQTEGIDNLFNRIIAGDYPNLERERERKALRCRKPTGPKMKHSQTHHNQNTQHTEQRNNSKSCKRKKTSHM